MNVVQKSFGINIKVLSMLGLYHLQTPSCLLKVYSYGTYFILAYPVPILGVLYFLYEDEIDPIRIGDNAFIIAQAACQITKLLPFLKNGKKIKQCIDSVDFLSFVIKSDKHKEILNNYIRSCQRNSTVFLTSVIIGNFSLALRPFLSGQKKLLIDVWLPFGSVNDMETFWILFCLLVMGVAYVSIASAVIDPLIGGLSLLAAAYLKILKDNFQHLKEYSEQSKHTVKDKIKECVRQHSAILEFVNNYEKCFSIAVFSQFAGSVLVICFCCLQLTKIPPVSFSFFSMIGYLNIFLVQLYFYCYYGTLLSEESNTLTAAVYMGKWYEYSIEERKDLILIMEHCKRPLVVTSGKILDLSVVTFTKILRGSYSLLAVFKSQ